MAYVAIKPKTRPRASWDEDVPILVGHTVIMDEDQPIQTGLLDQNGTPLYRTPDKIKLGFL